MLESVQAPLFFGLVAAFATTLGLLAVAFRSDWSLRHANLFGLAAAGMLCSMAFLHMLPEAFALSVNAPIWLTVGFFGGLVMHFAIRTLFPTRETSNMPREAITPILAIGIHSFIDGIVYSVTFAASFSAGVFASVGLTLHEFPEGVIAFAILRRHNVSNWWAFFWAFIAAAFTTPFGVLVSAPFVYLLGEPTIGAMFALSAGLLLFVATGPLLSPLRDTPPVRGLLAVGAGTSFAILLMVLPLPGHDHSHIGHAHDHSTPRDFRLGN